MTTSTGPKRDPQTVGDALHADSVPLLMLTLDQVKAAVNLSEDTLRGALPSVLVGRARRIRWSDLQNWVACLPHAAA
jgi:hypothetical protein